MTIVKDQLISRLTVRLRRVTSPNDPIGTGILISQPGLQDRVYVLTVAHNLYAKHNEFTDPLDRIFLDFLNPQTGQYQTVEHVVDFQLVSRYASDDVAILPLTKAVVENITGPLPTLPIIRDRRDVTSFLVKDSQRLQEGWSSPALPLHGCKKFLPIGHFNWYCTRITRIGLSMAFLVVVFVWLLTRRFIFTAFFPGTALRAKAKLFIVNTYISCQKFFEE